MAGLINKRVAIAADRRADSIASLVVNMGGDPIVIPIQGKQVLNEKTCVQNVDDYLKEDFDWVILTTGIGARTLADAAQNHSLYESFIEKLGNETLAIRGSKTMDWLKENQFHPHLVAEDGTMKNLLDRLASQDKRKMGRVFLQAYNQDDALLKQSLEGLGYSVYLSKPYSFEEPGSEWLDQFTEEIFSGQLHAAVFTSKTQVKNLFANEAVQKGLVDAFNHNVLAVAVGKVTAKELEDKGIINVLQPEKPKMGTMVVKLDRYFRDHSSNETSYR